MEFMRSVDHPSGIGINSREKNSKLNVRMSLHLSEIFHVCLYF